MLSSSPVARPSQLRRLSRRKVRHQQVFFVVFCVNIFHDIELTPCQFYSIHSAFFAIETSLPVKIKVNVGDGEPIESALRRFKREVSKSGHLMELRHKRYFENPQQRAIRKVKEGRIRK